MKRVLTHVAIPIFCLLLLIVNHRLSIPISNYFLILSALLMLIVIHAVKFARLFFLLTNTRISLKKCFELYLRTTLVNIFLPLKLGELYRIYVLAKTVGNVRTAVLCVLSERFFDILAIITLIITQSFVNTINISKIGCIFSIALLLIWIAYRAFPQTILFLNYYLITKRHKKYDLQWLKICSFAEDLYNQEQEIIFNKGVILAFLSIISWICEFYLYYIIYIIFGMSFNFDIVSIYISDIFYLSQGVITSMYAILFAVLYCFAEIFLLIRWRK